MSKFEEKLLEEKRKSIEMKYKHLRAFNYSIIFFLIITSYFMYAFYPDKRFLAGVLLVVITNPLAAILTIVNEKFKRMEKLEKENVKINPEETLTLY